MIRAIRPAAMAQDDASLVLGWNITPNIAFVLRLLPGSASCGVLLYDDTGETLIATGAALVGPAQPCVLIPQASQTVGMVDADLGWHLLVTTTGIESQRTIRIGPAVDLPDEIHPVYGADDMAMVRATAAIDSAAHYIDDITVTCHLGLGAGLGDVVSVPVDGAAIVGQVASITWTATPDGTSEQAVIRRHVAIAPEAFVEIVPPTVADDAATATNLAGTSGNVLANDESGLIVVAVNGLSSNVGTAVDGDNGGTFVLAADGSWTFAPDGDFALLSGSETADTSITYHASAGTSEAMATLTVTVSRANAAPVAVDDTGETDAEATTSGNVLTNDTDADLDTLAVSQVDGSAANVGVAVAGSHGGLFTIGSDGAWTFDPNGDFDSLTGAQTATTSVTYHVSDGLAEDVGLLTVTVSAAGEPDLWTPAEITTMWWPDASHGDSSGSSLVDRSGNSRHAVQATPGNQPTKNGSYLTFDGADDFMVAPAFTILQTTSLFVVIRPHTLLGDRAVLNQNYGNEARPWQHYIGSTGRIVDWRTSAYVSGVQANVWFQFTEIQSAINIVDFWRSGNAGTRGTGSGGYPSSTSIHIGYGQPYGSFGYFDGDFCEAVLVAGVVSTDVRQKLEGYLAHKWDALLGVTTLVSALPTGHPYKSAPPYVE